MPPIPATHMAMVLKAVFAFVAIVPTAEEINKDFKTTDDYDGQDTKFLFDGAWLSALDFTLKMDLQNLTPFYFPKRAKSLWKIGERYYRNNPHKVPLFGIDGLEPIYTTLLLWADKETRDYTSPPLWSPLASQRKQEYSRVRYVHI